MTSFKPDFRNVLQAARNIAPKRIPVYEHLISDKIMEQVLNKQFAQLLNGNLLDKREYFRNYNNFFKTMGYDTVSYECCIGWILPGRGALGDHQPGVIKNRSDYEKYPWDTVKNLFFEKLADNFRLMGEEMPDGLKAVGGPGNGLFECVQEIVGYTNLCYIAIDDPELYAALFEKMGDIMVQIWSEFLQRFGDLYTVCRFGDDLGFKTATLIAPDDIRNHFIPQYKRVIDLVHAYQKPFLLHSCGNIFSIMDDLIQVAGIDAKHSNEDVIAPFQVWVEQYGDRIGNFGGVDTDVLCLRSEAEIRQYVREVYNCVKDSKGVAIGSGNSIPDYVPVQGYLAMVEAVREMRRE
jgi:uroporphyrinogen decarboxylase